MSFVREEFQKLREQQTAARRLETVRVLQDQTQAVPPMESLTHNPHWGLFVKLIQGKIEKAAERLREMERMDLENPSVSYESMVESKTKRLLVRQAIETYTEVRDLPKALLEEGREARKLLKEHGIEPR